MRLIPDLTHVLRRQPGPPSLAAYKREIRWPVDAQVLDLVVAWLLSVLSGLPPEQEPDALCGRNASS